MGRSLASLLRFKGQWRRSNRASLVAAVESVAHAAVDSAPPENSASTTGTGSAVDVQ
jgi:hypothetical protein